MTNLFALAALVPLAASMLLQSSCVPSRPEERSAPAKTHTNDTPTSPHRMEAEKAAKDPLITKVFHDEFDRKDIGTDWRRVQSGWHIRDGKLCGRHARNHGIWLARRLPVNARIEFEAVSDSPDGDIKAELWGDGFSGATQLSYTNATSYLVISADGKTHSTCSLASTSMVATDKPCVCYPMGKI